MFNEPYTPLLISQMSRPKTLRMEGEKLTLVAITGGKFHATSLTWHFQTSKYNFEFIKCKYKKGTIQYYGFLYSPIRTYR